MTREEIRNAIIEKLKATHGSAPIRSLIDGISVSYADDDQGSIVYDIPDEMLPVHATDTFADPVVGYANMYQLIDFLMPGLRETAGEITISFISTYSFVKKACWKDERIPNVRLCKPDDAQFLLFTIKRAHTGFDAPEYMDIFRDAAWHSIRSICDGEIWQLSDLLLLPLGYRYVDGEQTQTAINVNAERCRQIIREYLAGQAILGLANAERGFTSDQQAKMINVAAEVEALLDGVELKPRYDPDHDTYSCFRFSDEISEEGAYVIDTVGRLLRPTQVKNYLDTYEAEVAQLETWTNLPSDCMILYWRRDGFELDFQTDVICRQLAAVSILQENRMIWLRSKIEAAWRKRRTYYGTYAADKKCDWGSQLRELREQTKEW